MWEEEKQYCTTFSCEDTQTVNILCQVLDFNQFYFIFVSIEFFSLNVILIKSCERSRLTVDATDYREDVRSTDGPFSIAIVNNNP